MFRHVILFKLKPDVAATERNDWFEQGRQLPTQIEVIRAWSIGTNVLHQPRSYDVAIIADFDSRDRYQSYQDHPAHLHFHQGSLRLSENIASVDFEL